MPTNLEALGFKKNILAQKTKSALEQFNPQAIEDYRGNKRSFLRWLLTEGKNPFAGEGYALETVRKTHYKVDRVYRWMWKDENRYLWRFDTDKANQFCDYLWKFDDDVPQPQIVEYEKAINLLFSYWNHEGHSDIEWSYDRELKTTYDSERDHFRPDELRRLYEVTLSYDPFDSGTSWKYPSLIGVTNDLGLRPAEVKEARVSWMYPEKELVEIPASQAIKSNSDWTCGLSKQAGRAVKHWLDERSSLPVYEDTDRLWLNERGREYHRRTVNYLLDELIEEAGINAPRRNLTWYSIRHGVATMWAEQEGLNYAQEQLRHEKPETTMRYTHSNENTQSDVADGKW